MLRRSLLFFILMVFFSTPFMSLMGCNNQTPAKESSSVLRKTLKEEYELQEKCGKRCEEIFKKDYGHGYQNKKDSRTVLNYENHYNKTLNKCFMLIFSKTYFKEKTSGVLIMKSLEDVNDHKEYGNFSQFDKQTFPSNCSVLGKSCKSEEAWDSLVKPYMEDKFSM